jgi:hypothetical protein
MVRTAPSIEHVKRCYNAMNGGTGESYTIPRKKKTSTIVNEDSFLTFDGDRKGFLDVLVDDLGDFAAASGVEDGQECDDVSLMSLEGLGNFDVGEILQSLNSMDGGFHDIDEDDKRNQDSAYVRIRY